MNLKPILAANVAALMKHRKLSQMGIKRRKGIAQSTVGRVLRQETAADLDTVAALAKALDVDPWQLLIPNLDPSNLPALQPLSTREKALYDRLRDAAVDLAKINKG